MIGTRPGNFSLMRRDWGRKEEAWGMGGGPERARGGGAPHTAAARTHLLQALLKAVRAFKVRHLSKGKGGGRRAKARAAERRDARGQEQSLCAAHDGALQPVCASLAG